MGSFLTKVAAATGCWLFLLQSVAVFPAAFPVSTWFQHYQPIEDPRAMEFTRRGLTYAQTVLGVPGIPVTTVHLRLSVAISPTGALRTNFQLTETTDAEYGEFTVYMGCEPGDYAFYGQLTHEICHLLNANLHDAYAEGICTAFAERFLRAQGYDWSRWMAFFDQGLEPLYAVTYGMMREIWNLVGDLQIGNLLTCARYTPDGSGKMHLDVTTWLATLSEQMRCKVLES